MSDLRTRYRYGAPFVIPIGAPNPDLYIKPEDEAAAMVFARKSAVREDGIAALMATGLDRFHAAIQWDSQQAPRSTNKKQLTELNCFVPDSIDAVDDSQTHAVLWRIIYNLARMGIFLSDTNSYTDRDLLARLLSTILIDEIPDLPPTPDMSEFISVIPPHSDYEEVTERDQLLPRPDRSFFPS